MQRRDAMKRLLAAATLTMTAALTACGSGGGYQRGIFTGYVTDATEEEITSKVGKPDKVDTTDPNAPRLIYNKKTFDPDNMNKVDEQTIIVMKKDPASGKFKGAEVMFL
jgi:hypothetical protein